MPKSANLWKVIHNLIKKDSLVALRDQALASTTPTNNSSTVMARLKRKQELYNLVTKNADLIILAWMNLAVTFYNDTN